MDVNFKFQNATTPEPVRIEQVWAEKPGGGIVANPTFDVPATTAVGYNAEGHLVPIKAYRVVEAANSEATTIKIAKGSGVVTGDVIATGKKGVKCTAVNTANADYDVVTVTLGVEVAAGAVLYQAATAGTSVTPAVTPIYVTGNTIYANEGDQAVRLINGANLRKETANVSAEVVALMSNINLV